MWRERGSDKGEMKRESWREDSWGGREGGKMGWRRGRGSEREIDRYGEIVFIFLG